MKVSFYFVLWILIYPILGLFNNSFVNNNAFLVALAVVWGLSWVLNRLMPATRRYEGVSQFAPILEDVYTCNVASFRKRLNRDTNIETVTAVYFLVSTIVIVMAMFTIGVSDWFALIIFGLLTFWAISRSSILYKAKAKIRSNPTPEQCMEIADDTYGMDYASYYEARNGVSYQDLLPPRPRYYSVFKVVSIIFATISSLLGLLMIVGSIGLMLYGSTPIAAATAGMEILYGSLAMYFGVRDFISCVRKNKVPAKSAVPETNEEINFVDGAPE